MDGTAQMVEEESNNKLPAGETDDVNSEVVPSVDSDKNSPDWNLPAKITKLRENVQKRKRPRRKSKKRKYPYPRMSWQQRREMRNGMQGVEQFANGQPVAPYNTTQFLIEDHGDLENIDAQLQVVKDQNGPFFNNKQSRARDSSFSVDSDEDYFYSSPEDEEEFLTKEFSNAYEDLHVERLSSMSKSEIIHDYLQLEAKYEKAMIELKRLKKGIKEEPDESIPEINQKTEEHDRDTDTSSKSENELAEQLRISQLENKSLKVELEELQKENKTLHNLIEKNQSSSVDSESDSSSTTSLSSDSSSCDSDSDDEMNSTNTPERTQYVNQSESITENSTETNYIKLNGENGNLSLSEDEGSEGEKQETEK